MSSFDHRLCIEEHNYSVTEKYFKEQHNQQPTNLHKQFTILKKCHGKFEFMELKGKVEASR